MFRNWWTRMFWIIPFWTCKIIYLKLSEVKRYYILRYVFLFRSERLKIPNKLAFTNHKFQWYSLVLLVWKSHFMYNYRTNWNVLLKFGNRFQFAYKVCWRRFYSHLCFICFLIVLGLTLCQLITAISATIFDRMDRFYMISIS